jgi:hypothetical protein
VADIDVQDQHVSGLVYGAAPTDVYVAEEGKQLPKNPIGQADKVG